MLGSFGRNNETYPSKYGPIGRRIYKSPSAGATHCAYDGDNLIEETNSSGAVVARYSQGLNIDEPMAMLRSSATSFYEADGLGTITSLTTTAAALAQTYTFDSFGKETTSSGSLTNPFQYTGREFDSETSLYCYRARYYDPTFARFLSEDPIGLEGGVDLYSYVGNSPETFTDPYGEFPTWWHRQITNELAQAVFGGKCVDKAKAVADADANVDALNHGIGWGPIGSLIGGLQFAFHAGQGWAQPGPHFPNQTTLDALHSKAFNTCNLKDLGEYLHSEQDAFAHSGWSSFDHYTHLWIPDSEAVKNLGWANATMEDTIRELQQFKSKCLKCCQ